MGILCACLPVLAPLAKRCIGRPLTPYPSASRPYASGTNMTGRRTRPSTRQQKFSQIGDDADKLVLPSSGCAVYGRSYAASSEGETNGSALELGQIHVKNDVCVESTARV